MKIFDFSEKVGNHIAVFHSNFIMSNIVKHEGEVHIGCMHLQPKGIIGYHEAVVPQLLLIVQGEGLVCGADKMKRKCNPVKLSSGIKGNSMKRVQKRDLWRL